MFSADDDFSDWTLFDRLGVAATVTVLVAFGLIAFYGVGRGFIPTRAYNDANIWIGIGCAALCALCMMYLFVQLFPATGWRGRIGFTALCCAAGYFAALSGIPAMVTEHHNHIGTVIFRITSEGFSSRSCRNNLVAENPTYADYRFCGRNFGSPHIGDRMEITAKISDWGLSPQTTRVIH